MTVLEYLQLKYEQPIPVSLLKKEADIFGIIYPPITGWLSKYGHIVITPDMSMELRFHLMKRIDKQYYQSAIDILGGTLSPIEEVYIIDKKNIQLQKEYDANSIKGKRRLKQAEKLAIRIEKKSNISEKKKPNSTLQHKNKVNRSQSKQPTIGFIKKFVSKSSIDPTSDTFLNSFEWKAIRKIALNLHGSKCQCCGISVKDGAVLNVDHIKPRKFFPELALEVDNLQILCADCNHGKGNWDMTDSR